MAACGVHLPTRIYVTTHVHSSSCMRDGNSNRHGSTEHTNTPACGWAYMHAHFLLLERDLWGLPPVQERPLFLHTCQAGRAFLFSDSCGEVETHASGSALAWLAWLNQPHFLAIMEGACILGSYDAVECMAETHFLPTTMLPMIPEMLLWIPSSRRGAQALARLATPYSKECNKGKRAIL